MKKQIFTLILTLVSLFSFAQNTKVIFITGQSNAPGRASSANISSEELAYHSNALIWNSGSFQPLKVGPYANNQSLPNLHGVELPLTMKFKTHFPNEIIYIVKYGMGGSNIDQNSPGGVVYEEFKNNYFQPAINWLLSNGINPEVYIYYSQGEAEANALSYPNFNYKLSLLTENYKNILKSDIHFIFPEIIEDGILTHDTQVNNVFKNYEKNNSKISVINSKDFPSDDNVHWNYEGVNLLGNELFKIITSKSGGVLKYPLPYNFSGENVEVISQNKNFIGNVDFKNANLVNFPFQNKGEVYIDTSLLNSSKAKLNNKFNPYCSLQDAINALPADDSSTWVIHFLKGGTINGCELPFRNLEFKSDKSIIIDFTNVNQEGSVTNNSNALASATNVISHNFLDNNIKLISNYTGIQKFTNGNVYFKIEGNVAFDWKASGGSTASSYILQSRMPTNLMLREWHAYQTHGGYILGFADGSNIIIKKFVNVDLNNKTTLRETNFNTLHNANITIENLNMIAGEFRSVLPVTINKITGTGIINSKNTKFNNCTAEPGITFSPTAVVTNLEGTLISDNYFKGTVTSNFTISNFEGKIGNLTLSGAGKVITKGNVSIDTTTLITTSVNDSTALEVSNGITVINGIVKSNASSVIIEKGILKNNN